MNIPQRMMALIAVLLPLAAMSGCGEDLSVEYINEIKPALRHPSTIRVIIVGQNVGNGMAFVQGFLAPFGYSFFAQVNNETDLPTLSVLNDFDVALVWSDQPFKNADLLGDTLATYIDQGGRVVSMSHTDTSSANQMIGGRYLADGYSPQNNDGGRVNGFSTLTDLRIPTHPILDRVTTLGAFLRSASTLRAGAVDIARWADGNIGVATNAAGTVAHLAFHPAVDNPSFMDGDFALITSNALRYVTGN